MHARNLEKSYGDHVVFKNVSLSLSSDHVTVLSGHSGCGKSTLLRCMALLESFDEGTIEYEGFTITPEISRSGYVHEKANELDVSFMMQELYLWPHLTCRQNVQVVAPEFNEWKLFKRLGVQSCLDRTPNRVSLGQAQRVAFIRAVSIKKRILLLDEPTSALDHKNTENFANLINEYLSKDVLIMIVSHDQHFISSLENKTVLEMENGKIF